MLDDGIAARDDRVLLAVDRRDPGFDQWPVLAQFGDRQPHQRAAIEGAHGDQAEFAACEFEHLQGSWKADQLADVVGDDLFRTEREIDREIAFGEELRIVHIVGGAQSGDTGRQVEHRLCDLAGTQVDLVGLGHRDQQVGIFGAGLLQHRRRGGIADDGAQVVLVLHCLQQGRVGIDHRDVIGLGNEVFCDRGADLAGPENDDLHAAAVVCAGNRAILRPADQDGAQCCSAASGGDVR